MSTLLQELAAARMIELGRPLEASTPVSPNHPPFRMALIRRHGDSVRADGMSGANELLSLGGHTGTHIDALSHVASHGHLHGGADAFEASRGGRFTTLGVETIAPVFARGVLLDVPRALGVEQLQPAHTITAEELALTAETQGTQPGAGDVVLVRTGWPVGRYSDPVAYAGHDSGVPGPDVGAATWLSSRGIRATGSDTLAYEWIAAGVGHALLPVHTHLLFESGIHIFEVLDLEEAASMQAYEFLFVAVPLRIVGATGSPIRPVALVP